MFVLTRNKNFVRIFTSFLIIFFLIFSFDNSRKVYADGLVLPTGVVLSSGVALSLPAVLTIAGIVVLTGVVWSNQDSIKEGVKNLGDYLQSAGIAIGKGCTDGINLLEDGSVQISNTARQKIKDWIAKIKGDSSVTVPVDSMTGYQVPSIAWGDTYTIPVKFNTGNYQITVSNATSFTSVRGTIECDSTLWNGSNFILPICNDGINHFTLSVADHQVAINGVIGSELSYTIKSFQLSIYNASRDYSLPNVCIDVNRVISFDQDWLNVPSGAVEWKSGNDVLDSTDTVSFKTKAVDYPDVIGKAVPDVVGNMDISVPTPTTGTDTPIDSTFSTTLWDWLQKILEALKSIPNAIASIPSAIEALPSEIAQAIKDILIELFVPSDTYFKNKFDDLKITIVGKYSNDLNVLNSLKTDADEFKDITAHFNFMGIDSGDVVVISSQYIRQYIFWIRMVTSMFWIFLLLVYIYNQIYFLIRGTYPIVTSSRTTDNGREVK